MSFEADDPFTTPQQPLLQRRMLDLDAPPVLEFPTTSDPAQLRRTLQTHLDETKRRLERTGELGNALVEQEKGLVAAIKELDDGTEPDPELKRKLSDLEKDYHDLGQETTRQMLTGRVIASSTSPFGGSNISAPSPTILASHGSVSPTKLGVPSSRRQRNQQPSRQQDLEFATEIGQSLIAEVRKAQAHAAEADAALKALRTEKELLEDQVRATELRLRALDESEQRYREVNWNLEFQVQELQAEQVRQKEVETKLQTQIAQLGREKTFVIKELDDTKQQFNKVSEELELKYKHHDTEVAALRKTLTKAEIQRDDLQKKVEGLKLDLDHSRKESVRLRQMEQRSHIEEKPRDPLDLSVPGDETPEHSPPPSPTKHTPRHSMLETETLKSSLHHAHRMITNLKSNVHREKTEKAELKRLLQEARDELESARNGFGPPSHGKRRKDTLKRRGVGATLIGGARKSRDEVNVFDDPDWEEADDSDMPTRRAPGAYISSLPATDMEEGGFETANEKDTTDAFETANELEATENEAYRTGAESPINDNPTSADDLTETEDSIMRHLRPRASRLSRTSGQTLRMGRARQRMDSLDSTASTEDECDGRGSYNTPEFNSFADSDMDTPEGGFAQEAPRQAVNPKFKLRINRNRSRGARIASDSSIFNGNALQDTGSSPPSFDESSPCDPRSSAIPPIKRSLFAELGGGDSPGMSSTDDGGDEEATENEDYEGTPTKSTFPPSARSRMVDSGINTEVPYPETPILLEEHTEERPGTAITVQADTASVITAERIPSYSVSTFDTGTQGVEEPKPSVAEVGTQSDDILEPKPVVSEMGTQSDDVPELKLAVSGMGIQLDGVPKPKLAVSEMGTQSDDVPKPKLTVSEVGTQSDEVASPKATVVEAGTQSDEILRPKPPVSSMGTQYDTEIEGVLVPAIITAAPEVSAPVKKVIDNSAQSDMSLEPSKAVVAVISEPELVTSSSVVVAMAAETIPTTEVQEPTARAAPVIAPPTIPAVEPVTIPLEISGIKTIATSPVDPTPPNSRGVLAVSASPAASVPSDEDTPKKVSETVENRQGAVTPPPSAEREKRGFFGSFLFGRSLSRKETASSEPESKPEPEREQRVEEATKSMDIDSDNEGEETIRQRTHTPSRPTIRTMPHPIADHMVQTDISSDFFDKLAKEAQGPKRSIMVASVNGAYAPSIRSKASQDSLSRTGRRPSGEGARLSSGATTMRRPSSSSSMREQRTQHPPLPANHQEQIAAAQKQIETTAPATTLMGPPPIPVHRASPAYRPRTPVHDTTARRPETPNSRAGATPKARISSGRSEISSPISRRSSLSSFASELDDRFQMHNEAYQPQNGASQTDPRIIQAITQTMIGEFLWKYTRATGRGTMSSTRHRRFFWVHPYTRTLYWSDRDPQSAGRAELRAKSVPIEAVRVVTDDNPSPPGLHRKSLIVVTPGRSLKFTAPTATRHETWFNALSYLLLRNGEELPADDSVLDDDDIRDYNPNAYGGSMSSFYSRNTRTDTPSRLSYRIDRASLSGSMSRLSNIFRPASSLSSRHSRQQVMGYSHTEELDESLPEHHNHASREIPGMENVRACCDGKHDVGTLSRKGGRKSQSSYHSAKHSIRHSHDRNHSQG